MGKPQIRTEVECSNFQIRAELQPASYDSKNRTVEVVMSSGYRGQRYDFFSDSFYMEELDVSDAAIRKDRLDLGMPVLTNHSQFSSGKSLANVGVVTSYRIENGQLMGTLKMSRTKEVEPILQDLEDGIIRSVSLGYRVHKYLDVTTPTDTMQILRAVDWEPMEVSLVSIPFDPKAQTRSAPSVHRVLIETKPIEGETMKIEERSAEEGSEKPAAEVEKKIEAAPAAEGEKVEEAKVEAAEVERKEEVKAEEAPAPAAPSVEEVRSSERVRSSTILEAVRKAGLETKFAQELITKGTSIDEARALIIDTLAERGDKPLSNKNEIQVGDNNKSELFNRGIVNAVMHRANPATVKLTEEGRHFRGMRMSQIAAEVLEAAGIKTRGMSSSEIASKVLSHDFHIRAGEHGTGDFSSLMADVANKTLRQAYEETEQTFKPFVRQVTAPDFKNINRVQLGEFASLEKVNEHGNLQYGTISDSKETYKIYSYAKGLKLTKQAIVNDDMDGFSRMAMLMGRAASRLESDLIYSILLLNANMGDSVALFHSSHGNLGSTAAISETTLKEMRKLGRKQTGLNGALLNVLHKYLIVSPELEVTAMKEVGAVVPTATSGVNVFKGSFDIIVDPRISAGVASLSANGSTTAWFAAASPSDIDTIEIAYLEGEAGPKIVEDVDFDSQGVKMAVWHDVGAKAIDYRGLFKNIGA
jgi:hypothetical protein